MMTLHPSVTFLYLSISDEKLNFELSNVKQIQIYDILQYLIKTLRNRIYLTLAVPTPGFPSLYYMLGANLWLLLYRDEPVMLS